MRFVVEITLLINIFICWNLVFCSLYHERNVEHDYPYNVDVPSVVHKYDFDDPRSVHNAKRVFEDGQNDENDYIDYASFEDNENREYERRFSNWQFRNEVEINKGEICETKDCHAAAEEIRNSLDTTVNPCEDFDKFACGGWRLRNPIPKSQSQWTQFSKLWRQEETLLKNAIERQKNSPADSSAALIYSWYFSCLNEKERAERGDRPLLELIRSLGSCPIISPTMWSAHSWSFVKHLVQLNRLAIHPFFVLTPNNDLTNSSNTLLTISVSKLLLESPSFYIGKEQYYKDVHRAYLRLMIDVVLKLRQSLGVKSFKFLSFGKQLINILKLERYIAMVLHNANHTTYHKMSLNKLQREVPWFPWKYYIRELYSNISQKRPITGNETVAIYKLYALKKITRILKLTPNSVKANFLIWNVAYRFIGTLGPDYEGFKHRFIVAMYGKKQRKERWRECVSSTSAALPMAVGKLFIEDNFDTESKEKAEKIIEGIRQQLIKDFEDLSWMDQNTTENAKEKAEAIVKNIGFPKFILNETSVKHYYEGMHFNPDQFLSNILQRRRIISHNTLKSREKEQDRESWSMGPQEINAYYSMEFNKIGILQPPFWHASYPMSIQFGGMGFIVGHEISHGFDVSGMHYDKYGNYFEWWTNSSKNAFKQKSSCLRDQYSKYEIFGKHLNGLSTLGENIADNGGIRLAYKAYESWKRNNNDSEERLPGLPYTQEQLFFMKGAQMWCANIRKKAALNSIDTDEHTLKMFRIIGPFSNLEEFSKAFSCPLGSKMNPEKKCRVW